MTTSFHHYVRSLTPMLSAGILAADVMHIGEEIEKLDGTGVKMLHFDVMDGVFCPMITTGPCFIKGVKTKYLKDVHLMVQNPITKISQFAEAGADMITVHLESCPDHIHALIQAIKKLKNVNSVEREIIAGVAINPGTPVDSIKNVLDVVDMITILAVNPGWQGQSFIKTTAKKLQQAISLINESERDILLCIDGGVTKDNIHDIAQMAPDIVVAGSAIFDGKDPQANARFLVETLKKGKAKEIIHET
ncbi:MAG TPA: ribulose-phosphate 3-epimerase [bacterium]|nr:ribulose-phosphate 3-epimerase [bacterium]HOL50288.1 ribulose-phosphate 3-epimerase [bacterium]